MKTLLLAIGLTIAVFVAFMLFLTVLFIVGPFPTAFLMIVFLFYVGLKAGK